MVTLAVADCPVPLKQFNVYVVVTDGVTVIEPDVDSFPDQPFDAVQYVALVEFQISVEELPWLTNVGFAVMVTVGCCCC